MDIKKVLKENNFIFEKKFGQNFLTDLNLLGSIVENSNVDKNSTVVEIGVGAGTLTGEIAKRVKKVYGFEIDTKLQPILSKTLQDYSNVELIFKDVLKVGVKELENILKALEDGQLSLDEAIKIFEKSVELSKICFE